MFLSIILQKSTNTTWPYSLNPTNIQLISLFPDKENTFSPISYSVHSRALFKAAILFSQQYDIKINGELLTWQIAQTNGDAINGISSTCQVISNPNIVGIVGPAFSRETSDVAAYAATDPSLSDSNAYPTFHRTFSSDNIAAIAITK